MFVGIKVGGIPGVWYQYCGIQYLVRTIWCIVVVYNPPNDKEVVQKVDIVIRHQL